MLKPVDLCNFYSHYITFTIFMLGKNINSKCLEQCAKQNICT
jgi:hypothetical protein